MKIKKNNRLKKPSRKQMILYTLIYFASIILLVLSMTDLFSESIFKGKYILLYFLMIGVTFQTHKMHLNYWNLKNE